MLTLFHAPFSPASRFVRLLMSEYGLRPELIEERPWERRRAFLELNPAGAVPVMVENDGPPICGAAPIMEYIDETRGYAVGDQRLMPDHPESRAEARRLVFWALDKFDAEAMAHLVRERIDKRNMPRELGGGAPDSEALRVARRNLEPHLRYFSALAAHRKGLAGHRLSFADFAVAAALSVADYLGEVAWVNEPQASEWYARIKSRPSFRGLLGERIPGIPPSKTYADLDF